MTFEQICMQARSLLRQAKCPECGTHGWDDSEECEWCQQRVEFMATQLLRNFDDVTRAGERMTKKKAAGSPKRVATSHDWTGPNRWHVHVHCKRCGKIFEIGKAKGQCLGASNG